MSKVGHSIWIDSDLDAIVKNHALTLGLGYNNVVDDALRKYFNVDRDPLSILMQTLRMWLLQEHTRDKFPEDIVLHSFMHIERTPDLRKAYDLIVKEGEGRAQAVLNRRIGQGVAKILNATVSQRKVLAKNCKLIRAYSRLIPS